MKIIPRHFVLPILLCAVTLLLSSCIFEKPIYPAGGKLPPSDWMGMWVEKTSDNKPQVAALIPLDAHHALLHYPANKNGLYFDAQAVRCRDRHLLQLKLLASESGAKIPANNSDRYTLLWVEPQSGGVLSVRALDGTAIKNQKLTPKSLRKFLASPDSDWNKIFGSSMTFGRP